MKKLIFALSITLLYSCGPASNGDIHQDEKGCTILTNTSSSNTISFTLQYSSVDYKWSQTVAAGADAILGCSDDAKTIKIVGASVKY